MPLRSALLWLGLARLAPEPDPAPAPAAAAHEQDPGARRIAGPDPDPGARPVPGPDDPATARPDPRLAQVPEPPPGEPELRWAAPPGCPDRAALLEGVARRRGRPLVAGEVTVDARVTRIAGPRYRLHLHVRAGARSEQRSLTAETCAPLADATALLITLTIDAASDPALPPGVTPDPDAPPVTPDDPNTQPVADPDDPRTPPTAPNSPVADPDDPRTPTTTAPNSPVADPDDPRTPANTAPNSPAADPLAPDVLDTARDPAPRTTRAPPTRRPGGVLRLHGGPERGAVPGFSGAVGLALGLLWPRWRLELAADFVAPRTATPPQATLRVSLLTAGLHACARPGRGALELPICGGVELGGTTGRASGPGIDRPPTGLWFAGVLGVGLAWRFHPRLALWTALQARLAVRPSFQLRDPDGNPVLFEPSLASGRLLLGLELRFGDRR